MSRRPFRLRKTCDSRLSAGPGKGPLMTAEARRPSRMQRTRIDDAIGSRCGGVPVDEPVDGSENVSAARENLR